jgi:protein-disulfide isomerase
VIYEAIQELQRRQQVEVVEQQRATVARLRDEIFAASGDPLGGDPAGDVTVVEFFDYNCHFCRSMAADIRSLLERDPRLRFVFKDLPILGPGSADAARAALAAARQGKYAELHFALMRVKELNRSTILEAAGGVVGLDVERLARDMDDPAIAARIERNMALAKELGVDGTPAFVVGDQIIPGATEVRNLAELVDRQRKTAAN